MTIGAGHGTPRMRAAFREGIGCVILAPDQTLDDSGGLPQLTLAPPPGDPATIAWPDGDRVASHPLPAYIDENALQAASDWSFDRASPEQVTLSLLVVHRGRIIPRALRAGLRHDDADPDVVDG